MDDANDAWLGHSDLERGAVSILSPQLNTASVYPCFRTNIPNINIGEFISIKALPQAVAHANLLTN